MTHRMKFQPGYGEKQAARVLTVDRSRRRVEMALRDGGVVYAAIFEIPAVFRWPKQGEIWTIRRDHGIWRLDSMFEHNGLSEAGVTTLESLEEGEVRIVSEASENGSGVIINNAHAARIFTAVVGNGSSSAFTLTHNFGTEKVAITIQEHLREAILGLPINTTMTTITVDSTSGFDTNGTLYLEDEIATYASKTGTTFVGLTRGQEATTATIHQIGTQVFQPAPVVEANPYIIDKNRARVTFASPPSTDQFRVTVIG